MIDNKKIKELAESVHQYVIDIRHKVHMHPEVGMQEFETAKLICSELEKMGIEHKDKVGGTGVLGIIKGELESPSPKCIGMRADMDALTIHEKTGVPYASKIPGLMHACGHDTHVAMLLGAAKLLNGLKSEFAGTIKLFFQPAEEGPGGAKPMIEDGVLENPKVDAVIGFHVSSGEPTGKIGLKYGPVHAAQDQFEITIKGVGGHAAYPHRSVDAIVLAAQAVQALQTVVSRKVEPSKPAVLTVGTIHGGDRHNIIADKVVMEGTFRYLDDNLRYSLRKWTEEVLEGVTKPVGGDFEVKYIDGYPATNNDKELFEKADVWVKDLLGPEGIYYIERSSMGAEDFSYFCRAVPSLFMPLGAGGRNGEFSKPHHHPEFNIDEDSFVIGVATFLKIALEFLK